MIPFHSDLLRKCQRNHPVIEPSRDHKPRSASGLDYARPPDGGTSQAFQRLRARLPRHSDLDWAWLGAVPEMLQTAYGSLTVGLDVQPGGSIRGGTSSVGMAAAVLAKRERMTVLSTTRNPAKADALRDLGVDHVIEDRGPVAERVRELFPDGVDSSLELVGAPTLRDTLRSTREHGTVCFTGMLSNEWLIEDFYPIDFIPSGVRLTAYSGDASDLPPDVLQKCLDDVTAGRARIPLHKSFPLSLIADAHRLMEESAATGKLVVLPWAADGDDVVELRSSL